MLRKVECNIYLLCTIQNSYNVNPQISYLPSSFPGYIPQCLPEGSFAQQTL